MLDLLKGLGLWGAFYGALFTVLWGFFALMKGKDDPSRRRVIDWLENDTPAQTYRRALTGLLDWLDARLSAREIELGAPEGAAGRAWSGALLGLLLILALAYPLLSVFGQWVMTGVGRAGDGVIFPREENDLIRYGLGTLFLAFVAVVAYAEVKFTGTPRLVVQLVAAFLFLAVAVAFAFAVAVAGAGAVAGAFAVAVAFAVAGAVAGAGAVAVAFAVAGAVEKRMTKGAHPLRPPLLFSLSGLGIVCLSVLFTPTYPPRDDFSPDNLILFFSALPLLNALYDFASVGLTRHWLRKGLGGNMVWNGTRDAVAGLAIFIALGCTAIAFIHFVRPQDGVPLIDLPTLFDDLARNPGDYWWLFFMLFSTLLPTMTHAGIALFSAFTLAGPRLRAWLARLFRMGGRGDTHPDWIARTVLSALIAASVWLPVFVVVEGPALFPGLVDALTGVFRSFAEAIGALPPGVQI